MITKEELQNFERLISELEKHTIAKKILRREIFKILTKHLIADLTFEPNIQFYGKILKYFTSEITDNKLVNLCKDFIFYATYQETPKK